MPKSLSSSPVIPCMTEERAALLSAHGMKAKSYLGSGAYGDVFRVNSETGKELAVKYYRSGVSSDFYGHRLVEDEGGLEVAGEQVLITSREAEVLAGQDMSPGQSFPDMPGSDYFPQIHALIRGVTGEVVAVVMEVLEGEGLGHKLRMLWQKEKQLPELDALRISAGVLQALIDLHATFRLHNDVKPDNIFCSVAGVKLLDLGACSPYQVPWMIIDPTVKFNSIIATTYVAPEKLQGFLGDERSDLYSLGVVMFEMFEGRSPFGYLSRKGFPRNLLEKQQKGEFEFKRSDPVIERIVKRLLAFDPDQRFSNASEAARALAEYAKGEFPFLANEKPFSTFD